MFAKLFLAIVATFAFTAANAASGTTSDASPYKQVSRDEVVRRMQISRVNPHRRAGPSIVSPLNPVIPTGGNAATFNLYYTGAGLIETDNNPGNSFPKYYPPYNTPIPAGTSQNAAIQLCANNHYGYESFQIYYLASSDTWICRHYLDRNTDTSYFNVVTPGASPVYGYSAA